MSLTLDSCRICLKLGNIPLFDNDSNYANKIMLLASVEIIEGDGLPSVICSNCIKELDAANSFKEKILTTDNELRQIIKYINSSPQYENTNESFVVLEDIRTIENYDNNINEDQNNKLDTQDNEIVMNIETESITSLIENKIDKKKDKRKFHKKLQLKKRNDTHRIESSNNINKKNKDLSRKHMCDTCGKTFITISNLNDHVRIHSGDKPFVCPNCGQRFSQAGHLMVHSRTHTGLKPYQCDICSRSFTVSNGLKKHIRTHTGERPYLCSVCQKTFVTSYHLSNHFKRHTGEKNFKCDWTGCTLSFVNISEMKRHRVRHDKKDKNEIK